MMATDYCNTFTCRNKRHDFIPTRKQSRINHVSHTHMTCLDDLSSCRGEEGVGQLDLQRTGVLPREAGVGSHTYTSQAV